MWAEWASEDLRRAGHIVDTDEWDSAKDTDLLRALERAHGQYSQFAAIVSAAYLHATVPTEEAGNAAAAWALEHPGLLAPIIVSRCTPPPRFWQLSPVALFEMTDPREARRRLLERLNDRSHRPAVNDDAWPMTRFPGLRPAVWSPDMPRRNPYFTGRDAMLRDLRARLTADVTAVLPYSLQSPSVPHSLQGLGGVGKSQLAVEYAYRFQADYDLIWWIPADERASVRRSLAELAHWLDLGGPGAEQGELVNLVRDALRRGQPYQRWLLIFDNAEGPESLRHVLLEGPGHTLVTSRDQGWAAQADTLDVDVYRRKESTDFLLRRVKRLSALDADRLAEMLGDLPLALEVAAAWFAAARGSAAEYLGLLREQTALLLNAPPTDDYPLSVAGTWEISMTRLRERNPAAAQMLEICAFIGPNPISLTLFTNSPSGVLPEPLQSELRSPGSRTKMLRAIGEYSLARIEEGPDEPGIQEHRLVQAVIRDALRPEQRAEYRSAGHKLLAAANPGDTQDVANWPHYAALLPHVLTSDAVSNLDPEVRALVADLVAVLFVTGEYLTALSLAETAFEAWSPHLDPVAPDLLSLLRERARALRRLDRWDEALQISQTAYNLAADRAGENDVSTQAVASGLAAAHRRLGALETARELDQRILDRYLEVYGPEQQQTLEAAHNVALDHRVGDRFPISLAMDRSNAEAYARLYGPDNASTLFAQNNIARDLRECGLYYDSLALEEVVCGHYRELYGPDNPETLRAMKNLAVSRRKAGRYAEGFELAAEVLTKHKRKFGDKNLETLSAVTNFANDHRCLGQYAAGRGFAEEAVSGFRDVLGDNNGFTACVMTNLAVLTRLTGNPDQALTLNTDALAALRQTFGEDHRYTLTCAANMASDLAAMGEHEAARDLDEGTVAALRRTSGEDHPYTLSCALNLALDLRALGERTRYRGLLTDVLDRYRRTLGESHPEAASAARRERADLDIEPPPV